MAKLDRPLYGDTATGTLARALSFRSTANPPDPPGSPAIFMGTVAKIPFMSCRPSPNQTGRRNLYAAAVAAWNALNTSERAPYILNKPVNLTGYNFFLRLFLNFLGTLVLHYHFRNGWRNFQNFMNP